MFTNFATENSVKMSSRQRLFLLHKNIVLDLVKKTYSNHNVNVSSKFGNYQDMGYLDID